MKRKLKRPITLPSTTTTPHDRRATDLLRNAQVAPVIVDDPMEKGAKLVVMRSLRDDPLGRHHARGFIDSAQYEAGRHWQKCYEIAEIGGARAIDPSKEAVDGGGFRDNRDSDTYAKAFKDLCLAANPKKGGLTMIEGLIIKDVLANRMFVSAASAIRGMTPDTGARLFRGALDKLSILYGFAMRSPSYPQHMVHGA